MICKHCHTENANDAQFCHSCGLALAKHDESIKPNKRANLHKLFVILFIGTVVCFSYSCLSYFCYSSYQHREVCSREKYINQGYISYTYYYEYSDPLNLFSRMGFPVNHTPKLKKEHGQNIIMTKHTTVSWG